MNFWRTSLNSKSSLLGFNVIAGISWFSGDNTIAGIAWLSGGGAFLVCLLVVF